MKRILSLMIAAVLLLSALPLTAVAAEKDVAATGITFYASEMKDNAKIEESSATLVVDRDIKLAYIDSYQSLTIINRGYTLTITGEKYGRGISSDRITIKGDGEILFTSANLVNAIEDASAPSPVEMKIDGVDIRVADTAKAYRLKRIINFDANVDIKNATITSAVPVCENGIRVYNSGNPRLLLENCYVKFDLCVGEEEIEFVRGFDVNGLIVDRSVLEINTGSGECGHGIFCSWVTITDSVLKLGGAESASFTGSTCEFTGSTITIRNRNNCMSIGTLKTDHSSLNAVSETGKAISGSNKLAFLNDSKVVLESKTGEAIYTYWQSDITVDHSDVTAIGSTAVYLKNCIDDASVKLTDAVITEPKPYSINRYTVLNGSGSPAPKLVIKGGKTVSEVDCTVEEPRPDAKPDYSAEPAEPDAYTARVSLWYVNEQSYPVLGQDDAFLNNKSYRLRVQFDPNDGYLFTDDTVFRINGREATRVGTNTYEVILSCRVKVVSTFTVSGITEPVDGAAPNVDCVLPRNCGYRATIPNYGYVSWYTEDGDLMNPDTDTFEVGKKYSAQVTLIPTEGCEFADSGLTGTMNGKDATKSIFIATPKKRIYMSRWFTCAMPTAVSAFEVSGVVAPRDGERPTYAASAPAGAGYAVEDYDDDNCWQNGVCWYHAGSEMSFTDRFVAGETYTAQVSLVSEPGIYCFAASGLSGKLNGKQATVGAFNASTAAENIYVEYTFTCSSGVLLGDVDSDGEVMIIDATAIQRRLVSLEVASFDPDAADADEDGKLTILDATAIQRYLVKLPTNERIGTWI